MSKKKKSIMVWHDETETSFPGFQKFEDDLELDQPNGDEIVIACSFKKPNTKYFKKLKITIEEI